MTQTTTLSRCPITAAALAATTGCPHATKAAEFDPFQDAYMADTSEFVRWSREEQPLFYSPKLDYWVVTRYDTVRNIFRDPITYSASNVLEPVEPPPPEMADILKQYDYQMNRTLVNEDEPAHMARRRALMAPFTPEHLHEHEPLVRQLVTEAIDKFIHVGETDLVKNLFWEVPFSVALHFLGIDDESDREEMHQFAIAHTINAFGRPTPEQRVEIAHKVGQFWQLSGRILDKMRKTPDGPGWMRYSLRQQREYPDVVTDSYLHSMMMAVIVAAHETTTFATANAVKLLLEHPATWNDLCKDPSLISPAVEECLRHSGSIASWRRRTTREVEIEGTTIPAGARLLLVVQSANHDPRHFDDPDHFDIRRANSADHLTFGFGAHQCLGKNLGRMEMQIMIGELTRRIPHLTLMPQQFEYVHNLSFRGPRQVKVSWDPAACPEHQPGYQASPLPAVRIGAPLTRDLVRELRVSHTEQVGDGMLSIHLTSPHGEPLPRWSAGAHIEVECGHHERSRAYSLCGDPDDRNSWTITVQHEPQGRGGSDWIHRHVKTGNLLRVRGPRNHFSLDLSTHAPLLFIAGGIGITPIMTQAETARRQGLDYQLHYSARTTRSMPFAQALRATHGERLHLHVSEQGQRNDFDQLLAAVPDNVQIYACGPERLLEGLTTAVARRGLPDTALHVEHFNPDAGATALENAAPFTAELRASGLILPIPSDRTLLQVLRANNVDIPSDCEEGLCGACEVPVVSGEVDHRDRILGPAERRTHQRMMSCCSRANGDRLVLDL